MMKLTLTVFNEPSDVYASQVNKEVHRDFAEAFNNDHDETCADLPTFSPKWFHKKVISWFEYKGDYYVFVSRQIVQKDIGHLEHCIYTLTGRRGVGNHIDRLEFIATPNVPIKKFIMKRV